MYKARHLEQAQETKLKQPLQDIYKLQQKW